MELSVTALAQRAGTSLPTALRELGRAERARMVASRRLGNTRLVRADPSNPLYNPLRELVLATYGPPAVLARELGPVARVRRLYLHGAWVAAYRGQEAADAEELELLVVGRPDRSRLAAATARAGSQLGYPVRVEVRTEEEWGEVREGLVRRVREGPHLSLLEEPVPWTWAPGRAVVEALLLRGALEAGEPAPGLSDELLEAAGRHLHSAQVLRAEDPASARQLASEATLKACAALLALQGLSPTQEGGEPALLEAAEAQFGGEGGPEALRSPAGLRRRQGEVSHLSRPLPGADDAEEALSSAAAFLVEALRLRRSGRLGRFRVPD